MAKPSPPKLYDDVPCSGVESGDYARHRVCGSTRGRKRTMAEKHKKRRKKLKGWMQDFDKPGSIG
jgi:hypothetical protein